MKKSILFAFIMMFMISASTFATTGSKKPENIPNTENKIPAEEVRRLTSRVEEIRDMDKTGMSTVEKKELKNELKEIKKNVRRDGGIVYISAGTLILIIILVILLF